MPKISELVEQRNKAVADARSIHERYTAAAEFRTLSDEDKAVVDKALADASSIDELIEALQAVEQAETTASKDDSSDDSGDPGMDESKRSAGLSQRGLRNRRKSLPQPLRTTNANYDEDPRSRKLASAEYRKVYGEWLKYGSFNGNVAEYRDVTISPNSSGGYLTTPTQISQNIIQIINNLVFIRQMAKIETVKTAQSLGVRQVTTQPSDAAWTTEIGVTNPDTAMAFGQRALTPNLLAKLINVSIRTLQIASDVTSLVDERLAYKFAVAEENAFLNGSGTNQPLGVYTPSASGIPTSTDSVVSTSGAPTVISPDLLIGAKYNLKQPYLEGPSVAWVFSRPVASAIRLLKDSYNRYLWVDGGGLASAPSTLLDVPVKISEYSPSVLTNSAYVGILGNFSYYEICDVEEMEIQRLVELFAGNHEVGFLGRRWLDGAPVLGEAFTRLILHS